MSNMFLGLSEAQKTAFDFLVEFYAPHRNRAMGRSYLMAAVIIKTAVDNPGLDIQLIDHSDIANNSRNDRRRNHNQVARIVDMIIRNELPEEMQNDFILHTNEGYIRYQPRGATKGVCFDSSKVNNIEWPKITKMDNDDT